MKKYQPMGYSEEIRIKRHSVSETETFAEACYRVAEAIAKVEDSKSQQRIAKEFEEILITNRFSCGGRIWYNAGRNRANLLNCFAIPSVDSREGWGQLMSDFTIISSTGGGVGMPFSAIRPNGAPIRSNGGSASGPISLMTIIDKIADVIKGGGGRRAACMFALHYKHPDIFAFLDKKLNLNELLNANISVMIDEDFVQAVRDNEEVETEFAGRPGIKYNAREMFARLLENAIKTGEPGILNLGLANHFNNHYYREKLIVTNPCGELFLPRYGACDLGSLVLPTFVVDGELDFETLGDTVSTAVRFLDNVLDANHYPLDIIEEQVKRFRRIGLGVMGLHDMLLLMGHKYDSDEGLAVVDKVMNFIKKKAYEASTYLAVEKGCFPEYDRDPYMKANFIKGLSASLRSKIRRHGIRNAAMLTLAPTGTTSIVAGCSGGVESLFSPAYLRAYIDSVSGQTITKAVVHPLFKKFVAEGKSVDHFQGAMDISPESHLKMQAVCQAHIDGSISKTINLPASATIEGLFELTLKYLDQLKGLTVYRDGSRGASPLTPLSLEEAKRIATEEVETELLEHQCSGGSCSL